MNKKLKARLLSLWRNWGKPLLVVIVVLSTLRSAVADWHDVPTGSMKPTILEGDRIFVNKLAYDLKVPFTTWHVAEWADPEPGDVVVFYAPETGTLTVKRVVGVPGDTIELRNNHLLINGQPTAYGPLSPTVVTQIKPQERARSVFARETLGRGTHAVMLTPALPAARTQPATTVPPGHYYLMGDNRDNSRDSRYFGFVPRSQILGKVKGVALSFDPEHYYLPRFGRFFSSLR